MRIGALLSGGLSIALTFASGACTAPMPSSDVVDGGLDVADPVDTGTPLDVTIADQGVCRDMDNDGHPAAECGGDDCDDNNPRRNPGAREVCDSNGVDEDCNPCTVAEVTLSGIGGDGDRDEDGFFNQNCFNRLAAGAPRPMCGPSETSDGGVPDGGSVGGVERLRVSATMVTGTDCADDPAASGGSRFPGALEVCNMLDDDCDGMRDEDLEQTFYRDRDGDGFGDRSAMTSPDVLRGCSAPGGYALNNLDCDDARASVSPAAREVCDFSVNVDENCNGVSEEDCGCGAVGMTRACCSGQGVETCSMTTMGSMWGTCSARPTGMPETCNGRDDDCNGVVDEGLRIQCFPDGDGDGYAAAGSMTQAVCPDAARPTRGNCPANFTNVAPTPGNIDCNDSAASQAPRLPDLCDTIDNDCDASTTDGTTDVRVGTSCAGGSGTGRCAAGTNVCTGTGIVCQRNTAVLEMCNAIDDDCDGMIDEPTCAHATFNGAGQQVITGYGGGCASGNQCVITSCVRGRGNCDGNNVNGCESVFATDPNHCGGCAVRCLEGSVCANGICTESRVSQVSAGQNVTCTVSSARRVYCTGANDQGQIGDGTMINRTAPTLVAGVTNAAQVATGAGAHVCAVRQDGAVLCWGLNNYGQLGDGTITRRLTPALVEGLTNVVEVAVGARHTCARRMDRTVWCWGENFAGELGDGTQIQRTRPTLVAALTDVVEISAGASFACARTGTGEAFCWGLNSSGQLGDRTLSPRLVPTRVGGLSAILEIETGNAHTCARTAADVLCWGANSFGQVGQDPLREVFVTTPRVVSSGRDVTELSMGTGHSCVRRSSGRVSCWGQNTSGQIGVGGLPGFIVRDVSLLRDAASVSAGGAHTCAARTNGQVVCWGGGASGNLGQGSTASSSTPVAAIGNAIGAGVAVGFGFSCTRRNTGEVLCWGNNELGQLGDGGTVQRGSLAPVASINNAVDVQAGLDFACALRSDGTVSCWGDNRSGQLGNGTVVGSRVPVTVTGLSDAVQLTAGDSFACALRAGGAVVCWGRNLERQLGDGTTMAQRTAPAPVVGLTGAIAEVSAGREQTCVRRLPSTDGTAPVFCFGSSAFGELGIGTTTPQATPITAVMGGFEWVQVSAGSYFTCARRSNGQPLCWGSNDQSRLGDGTSASRFAPSVPVIGAGDAAEVVTGREFGCVRRASGTVACWGANTEGQLGTPRSVAQNMAREVGSLSGVTALSIATDHACAARSGREVLCWGSNRDLKLGLGVTVLSTHTPTLVSDL